MARRVFEIATEVGMTSSEFVARIAQLNLPYKARIKSAADLMTDAQVELFVQRHFAAPVARPTQNVGTAEPSIASSAQRPEAGHAVR